MAKQANKPVKEDPPEKAAQADPGESAAPAQEPPVASGAQVAADASAQAAPETAEPGEDPGNGLEALREQLAAAEARAEENLERLARALAEMENLRKRAQRDVENAHKYALEGFVAELLAVRDSLEMGLAAAAGEEADVASIREGTALTLKMLAQVMDKFNITEIDPLGQRFDPEQHQAMNMVEDPQAESNTVLAVIQKGYALNQRLLRPALVSVAK